MTCATKGALVIFHGMNRTMLSHGTLIIFLGFVFGFEDISNILPTGGSILLCDISQSIYYY